MSERLSYRSEQGDSFRKWLARMALRNSSPLLSWCPRFGNLDLCPRVGAVEALGNVGVRQVVTFRSAAI